MTISELKEDAKSLNIPEWLYINWIQFNEFIARFIPAKSKYVITPEPNVHRIGEFLVSIAFVNKSYLELKIELGETTLMTLRLQDFDPKDAVVICTHILLVIEYYN